MASTSVESNLKAPPATKTIWAPQPTNIFLQELTLSTVPGSKNVFGMFPPTLLVQSPDVGLNDKLVSKKIGPSSWRFDGRIEINAKLQPLMFSVNRTTGFAKRTHSLVLTTADLSASMFSEAMQSRHFSTNDVNIALTLTFTCTGLDSGRGSHSEFNAWRDIIEESFDSMDTDSLNHFLTLLPSVPKTIHLASAMMFQRYRSKPTLHLLDASTTGYRRAGQLQKYSESTNYWQAPYEVALGLSCRYNAHGQDVEDLSKGIESLSFAIQFMPDDAPVLPVSYDILGNFFFTRYQRTARLDDLGSAVLNFHAQLTVLAEDSQTKPTCLAYLAEAFVERFEHTADPSDISLAISHYHASIGSTPRDATSQLVSRIDKLGGTLLLRFQRIRNVGDITTALPYLRWAVKHTHPENPNLPTRMSNLSASSLELFELTKDIDDLNQAISVCQNALQMPGSKDADTVALLSRNLAAMLITRFGVTKDENDATQSIEHQKAAISLHRADPTEYPRSLHGLGKIYATQFQDSGRPELLDLAISTLKEAGSLAGPSHPARGEILDALGSVLTIRSGGTSTLDAISSSIQALQTSISVTPQSDPNRHRRMAHLAEALYNRFVLVGPTALPDIYHAISLTETALSSPHADRNDLLLRLGRYLSARFARTWDLPDISRSIVINEEILTKTPTGDTQRFITLSNLGMYYDLRFQVSKNSQNVDSAITYFEKAIDVAPEIKRGLTFRGLANALTTRFENTKNLDDIARAISYQERALQLTPIDDPEYPHVLNLLGGLHSFRYNETKRAEDVPIALEYFKRSASHTIGSTSTRFQAAHNWASCCLEIDPPSSLPAFQVLINLLSEVAGMDQTTSERYTNLARKSETLARAVRTALDLGNLELGFEWTEQVRSFVWNQMDQLRAPLGQLRQTHPQLAQSFEAATQELERLSLRPPVSSFHVDTMTEKIRIEEEIQAHREQSRLRKRLLNDIRQLPGLSHFLLPSKAADLLRRLPPDGPIIVFNVYEDKCDALILSNFTITHIQLPNCGHSHLNDLTTTLRGCLSDYRTARQPRALHWERAEGMEHGISSMLFRIWEMVVYPIIQKLQLSVPTDRSNRPRVWWCPSGPLAFLPLHAAGRYGQYRPQNTSTPGSSVSDYLVSSYTPTVTALLNKLEQTTVQPGLRQTETKVLLVCQEDSPGQPPLPGAKQETNALRQIMRAASIPSTVLDGNKATVQIVKANLKTHDWVHFACHASQHESNPLGSGICLHDGRLQLYDVMEERLPNTQHAFLSACQTSRGYEALSEEAVHLAAAMLAAGYRGVVATMWEIQDNEGASIAKDFYSYVARPKLRNYGVMFDTKSSAYALDESVQAAKKRVGESESGLLTWVPYAHFGV